MTQTGADESTIPSQGEQSSASTNSEDDSNVAASPPTNRENNGIRTSWLYGEVERDPRQERVNQERREKRKEAERNGQAEEERDRIRTERQSGLKRYLDEGQAAVEARKKAWAALPVAIRNHLDKGPALDTHYPEMFEHVVSLLNLTDTLRHMSSLEPSSPAMRLLDASPITQDLLLRLMGNIWTLDPCDHPALIKDTHDSLGLEEDDDVDEEDLGVEDDEEDLLTDDETDSGGDGLDDDIYGVAEEEVTEDEEEEVGPHGNHADIPSDSEENKLLDGDSEDEGSHAGNLRFKPGSEENDDQSSHPKFIPYIRVCRVPVDEALRLLKETSRLYPADHVQLSVMIWDLERVRENMEGTENVSLCYAGASIAGSPVSRLLADEKKARTWSKLSHLIKVFSKHTWTAYRVPSLEMALEHRTAIDHPGKLDPSQLWMMNREAWGIEQMLISSLSQELSGNSAAGGMTNLRLQLTTAEQSILDTLLPTCRIVSDRPITMDPLLAPWMSTEHKDARTHLKHARHHLEAVGNQRVITGSAAATASTQASVATRNADGTVTSVTIGKDIPLHEGFNRASWYGDLAGGSAILYRHVRDLVTCRSDHTLTSFKHDLLEITKYYGPFLNLWSVCLIHLLVWLCLFHLLRKLHKLRPKVIFCLSDKVSWLFLSFLLDLHTDFAPAFGLLRVGQHIFWRLWRKAVRNRQEIIWRGLPVGAFLRERVGTVHVVRWGCGLQNYSVMVIGLDYGFYRYRPALQWELYRLMVLIALLHRLSEVCTEERSLEGGKWGKEEAEYVKAEVEKRAEECGLTSAISAVRQQVAEHLTNLTSLSGLPRKDTASLIARQVKQAEYHGIRAAKELAGSIVAAGESGSPERHAQKHYFQAIGSLGTPSPNGVQPLSAEWTTWFLALRQGIAIAYAVKRSYLSKVKAEENVRLARIALAGKREVNAAFPTFTSKISLTEVFDRITDTASLTTNRTAASTVVVGSPCFRLIDCDICDSSGITTTPTVRHWCGDEPSVKVTAETPGIKISKLLFPIQLLLHRKHSADILRHIRSTNRISVITSVGQEGTRRPTGAFLTEQSAEAKCMIFQEHQKCIGDRLLARIVHAPHKLGLSAQVTGRGELESIYKCMMKDMGFQAGEE